MEPHFEPLAATAFPGAEALRDHGEPALFKGLAGGWPAVRDWTMSNLVPMAPDIEVRLVQGNRERGNTRFRSAPLRDYLLSLNGLGPLSGQQLYLKEFDLVAAIPRLRHALRHREIFPHGTIKSLQSWIGPSGARTGLHYDYLDNLAVQIVGQKRFLLVRPGVVERFGAVARKYDSWARLSSARALDLAARNAKAGDFLFADIGPGDVLFVPARWWHEVENVSASILFGGFFGTPLRVLSLWSWVRSRDLLHRCGWLSRGNCTCHATP